MGKYINSPVQLAFYINSPDADPEVKEIFENDVARTLWLGYRPVHFVDQYFNKQVLWAAKEIRKNREKHKHAPEQISMFNPPDWLTFERLRMYVGCLQGSGFGYSYSKEFDEFIRELLPYMNGDLILEYEEPIVVRVHL